MGIHANIYDSSSGRDPLSVWPSMARQVLVLNADGPFERQQGEYAVVLEAGYGGRGTVRAVPVDQAGKPIPGTMKGYSYIASSDSRFSELVERITGAPFYGAVALHDRLELRCKYCQAFTAAWRLNAGVCLECDDSNPVDALDDDDGYPGRCTSPDGQHDWPRVEENERCLCTYCGADGDA